jgi:hypothetical protein
MKDHTLNKTQGTVLLPDSFDAVKLLQTLAVKVHMMHPVRQGLTINDQCDHPTCRDLQIIIRIIDGAMPPTYSSIVPPHCSAPTQSTKVEACTPNAPQQTRERAITQIGSIALRGAVKGTGYIFYANEVREVLIAYATSQTAILKEILEKMCNCDVMKGYTCLYHRTIIK